MLKSSSRSAHRGMVLLEVLVTIIVVAVGLLGLAGLQAKMQAAEVESYQRGQALWLVDDMVSRLTANSAGSSDASPYLTTTGGKQASQSCSALNGAAFDLCEWNNELLGASEVSGANKMGSVLGALGCVFQIQAPDKTPGTCKPGIYQIHVAWQGMHQTSSPASNCGTDADYGGPGYRRVISRTVTLSVPGCTSI